MTPLAAALALLLAGADKPNPYLAQARVFYQGAEFKKCVERLKQAERFESSQQERAEVALYQGLCRFYLKKPVEAEADFERALQLDVTTELPAASSPKIVEVWKRVRARYPLPVAPPPPPVVVAPEKPTVTVLVPAEPPPPAPVVVEAEPQRPLPVAPFVVGGLAVAAGIAAATFGLLANSNDIAARTASFQSDAIAQRRQAETFALVANVSWGVAAASGITALVLFFVQR